MNSIEKLVNTISATISSNAYRRGIDIHSIKPNKLNQEWIMNFIHKNGSLSEQTVSFSLTGDLKLSIDDNIILNVNVYDNKNAVGVISNAFNKAFDAKNHLNRIIQNGKILTN